MEILMELDDWGWAEMELITDEQRHFFCGNSINHILKDLLKGLYSFTSESASSPFEVVFNNDPGGSVWKLMPGEGESVEFSIVTCRDVVNRVGEALIHIYNVPLRELILSAVKMADTVLNKYGLLGYFATWGEEFPLTFMMLLKNWLRGSTFEIQCEREEHRQYYVSSLKREWELVKL